MDPVYFKSAADFRKWLEKNHSTEQEIFVAYYKKGSKKSGITYTQAVEQALCFGWIDGVARSLDQDSYCNRYTPRRKNSNWSAINIKKAELLIEQGLMHASGLVAFEKRKEVLSGAYSYENKPANLSVELESMLRSNQKAWEFFSSQSPSHQKTVFYWIMSAKQEKTRISRLQKLIRSCEEGKRL